MALTPNLVRTVDSFAQSNFAFLANRDPNLVFYAARAEQYVFSDPNTCLLKLRQFGELLARHASANLGLTRRTPTFETLCLGSSATALSAQGNTATWNSCAF